jgi:cell division protein FtsZ
MAPVIADPMAPVLVEAPAVNTFYQPVAQQEQTPSVQESRSSFNLELPKVQEAEAVAEQKTQPQEYKAPELELIIKTEEKPVQEVVVKRGERYLTPEEIEEQRRFEEQKKALEDRADRLRRMSFNIQGAENASEVENVPAYMRRQTNLDNTVNSNDNFLSGYAVNTDKDGKQGNISTINTFLDGKKPD